MRSKRMRIMPTKQARVQEVQNRSEFEERHHPRHHHSAGLLVVLVSAVALFTMLAVFVSNVQRSTIQDRNLALTGAMVFDDESAVGQVGCYDSDNGLDTGREGYVQVGDNRYMDSCFGQMRVKEYYCTAAGDVNHELSMCDGVCFKGRCAPWSE